MISRVAEPGENRYGNDSQNLSDAERELHSKLGTTFGVAAAEENRLLNHPLLTRVSEVLQNSKATDMSTNGESTAEPDLVRVFESAFLEKDEISAPNTDDVKRYPEIVIFDGANEFRISIRGRFAGKSVALVRQAWSDHLSGCCSVGVTVDISAISDYDATGRRLLREMFHHGTRFAAATAASLCVLSEISSSQRGSLTMIPGKIGEPVVPSMGDIPGALIL